MDLAFSAILGALIFTAFVGGLAESIGTLPFSVIVGGVILMMAIDTYQTIKDQFARQKMKNK